MKEIIPKIITKRVGVGGGLYWIAQYDPRKGVGKTEEEAIRDLLSEFPDDGAKTAIIDEIGNPPISQRESKET